ncbi:MAG: 2-C-methyl-D-erythritol 4-phosphate cytidylyltransferase [Proteobacteria bacterium]|nr:2-C-methyl-D-erythritol 4-phosphate cytidylyltransferase [Pseudomonadota bacterium]MBU1715317.1 2-C-methyl-D-erythritol 4-phosphate cytidylyltransferase [Pseudomonadota bacterium]
MPKTAAIIPAGGVGRRMGLSLPKQFSELAGRPILAHTIQVFQQSAFVDQIVVVTPADYCRQTEEIVAQYNFDKVVKVLAGGVLRQDSVRIGLESLDNDIEYVVVHDGVRPLVEPGLIESCVQAAIINGAAIAAIPVSDTIKEVTGANLINKTVDRQGLWQAQTPQVIRVDLLRKAFERAAADGFVGTDEASFLEQLGCEVVVVIGSERNIKVTRPEDLVIAEALIMEKVDGNYDRPDYLIGHGYDAHRLVTDRSLVLGGVTVPHSMGLLGHSDADVLLHALCDAILGAVGLGDIGKHFPDTDPQYKGISSLKLLAHVVGLAREKGWVLSNADITVSAQQPKLAPYLAAMRNNISQVCLIKEERINIKATSTEEMGFVGRQEGIDAHAVVLLRWE